MYTIKNSHPEGRPTYTESWMFAYLNQQGEQFAGELKAKQWLEKTIDHLFQKTIKDAKRYERTLGQKTKHQERIPHFLKKKLRAKKKKTGR